MLATLPLLGAALFACITLMALAPRRPRRVPESVQVASSTVNEVPLLFIAIVLVGVAPEVADGGPSSTLGRLALGLNLSTIAGLCVVSWRTFRDRRRLEQPLDAALGSSWRATAPAAATRLARSRPALRSILAPLPIRPRSVRRWSNIAYGDGGKANLLDVYRHRSQPPAAPTLIHLHGGRFRWGNKSREARPLLHHMASRGWTCISANYRLTRVPGDGFPGHLVDVKSVIAWARAHSDEYGIEADTILLSGSSAGAHLTAMAALTANEPAFQPGFEAVDTSIAAAIGFYGYYGPVDTAADPPSAPLAHDAAGAPPFLVIHGARDWYTPIEGARALARHVTEQSSNPVALVELEGAQHSFDVFHSVRYDAVIDAVEAFARHVTSVRGATSTATAPPTR